MKPSEYFVHAVLIETRKLIFHLFGTLMDLFALAIDFLNWHIISSWIDSKSNFFKQTRYFVNLNISISHQEKGSYTIVWILWRKESRIKERFCVELDNLWENQYGENNIHHTCKYVYMYVRMAETTVHSLLLYLLQTYTEKHILPSCCYFNVKMRHQITQQIMQRKTNCMFSLKFIMRNNLIWQII